MSEGSSRGFLLSITIHGIVAGLMFISFVLNRDVTDIPKVFQLVAGEGDGLGEQGAQVAGGDRQQGQGAEHRGARDHALLARHLPHRRTRGRDRAADDAARDVEDAHPGGGRRGERGRAGSGSDRRQHDQHDHHG